MPAQILIADDHELMRQGLRSLLESRPGWAVCAEAVDGREAVDKTKELNPDVVILDATMPRMNGLEAAQEISKISPRTRMLIFSMHDSEEVVRAIRNSGAHGYVLKSDAARDLLVAVGALLSGQVFFSSQTAKLLREREPQATF